MRGYAGVLAVQKRVRMVRQRFDAGHGKEAALPFRVINAGRTARRRSLSRAAFAATPRNTDGNQISSMQIG